MGKLEAPSVWEESFADSTVNLAASACDRSRLGKWSVPSRRRGCGLTPCGGGHPARGSAPCSCDSRVCRCTPGWCVHPGGVSPRALGSPPAAHAALSHLQRPRPLRVPPSFSRHRWLPGHGSWQRPAGAPSSLRGGPCIACSPPCSSSDRDTAGAPLGSPRKWCQQVKDVGGGSRCSQGNVWQICGSPSLFRPITPAGDTALSPPILDVPTTERRTDGRTQSGTAPGAKGYLKPSLLSNPALTPGAQVWVRGQGPRGWAEGQ